MLLDVRLEGLQEEVACRYGPRVKSPRSATNFSFSLADTGTLPPAERRTPRVKTAHDRYPFSSRGESGIVLRPIHIYLKIETGAVPGRW